MAEDIVDRVAADTTENEVVHTENAEEVDSGVEDVNQLPRPHKMKIYHRSAVNLHHFLLKEQEPRLSVTE